MNEELQELLTIHQQATIDLLLRIKQLKPQPETLPELPLSTLYLINNLLGETSSSGEITPTFIRTNTTPIATDGTSGDKTIIAPATNKSLRISSLYFVANSAVDVILKSSSEAKSGAMRLSYHAADYTHPLAFAVNESLVINIGSDIAINGYVVWWEV